MSVCSSLTALCLKKSKRKRGSEMTAMTKVDDFNDLLSTFTNSISLFKFRVTATKLISKILLDALGLL